MSETRLHPTVPADPSRPCPRSLSEMGQWWIAVSRRSSVTRHTIPLHLLPPGPPAPRALTAAAIEKETASLANKRPRPAVSPLLEPAPAFRKHADRVGTRLPSGGHPGLITVSQRIRILLSHINDKLDTGLNITAVEGLCSDRQNLKRGQASPFCKPNETQARLQYFLSSTCLPSKVLHGL